VFIADEGNNRIRKVSTNGIITTIAGSGSTGDSFGGYSGDGGLATSAKLNEPSGVAVDQSGNVFIADTFNNRIRKVSTNGIITTVAGSGNAGSYFGGYSGDGVLATNAELNVPYGVAIDGSGNVFIADSGNNRIRKVSTNGIISTVAGNGTGGFSGDGGAATNAELYQPYGVAVDGSGNVFIADEYNNRIREVINSSETPSLFFNSISTNNAGNYSVIITSSSGSVTSSVASLTILVPPSIVTQPVNQRVAFSGTATFGVTASGGDLSYQWRSNSVNILNATNATLMLNNVQTNAAASYSVIVTNIAGSVTSSNATLTVLLVPNIVTQPVNQVVVAGDNAIFSVSASGTGPFTYQWLLNGTNLPAGIISTVAGNGTILYSGGGYLDSGYGYSGDGGEATNAMLNYPVGVALDRGGNVFIADMQNNRIRKVSTNGIITTIAGNGSNGYSGDGGAATNAMLDEPESVAVDGFGNLFIADFLNRVIREVFTNGIICTVAGNGANGYFGDGGLAISAKMSNPTGVAVDGFGNLFIADFFNGVIREVFTNGIICTVAGNGTNGYSGDGGSSTVAEVDPVGVFIDGFGNLFIADCGDSRIRKVINFSISDNPLLMLNYVSTNNAGNYSVVIISSSGSVTSCIANLMILPTGQCQILSPASLINGTASLLFAGSVSANYALERFNK
jgi:sugar lactone lactonase YvrE